MQVDRKLSSRISSRTCKSVEHDEGHTRCPAGWYFRVDFQSYTMITFRTYTILLAWLALYSVVLQAQTTTKDGVALSWERTIEVVPDSIQNGAWTLPAHTITVFESDGGWVMDQWKDEMKPVSQSVSGSKPVRVTGALVPAMGDQPLLLLATSESDKKSKLGRLTVAFAANDSMVAEGDPARTMRELAVRLNKAVVQQQIDARQKMLDKASGKLSGAQSDQAKINKRLNKANSDLEKHKRKLSKLQGNKAKVQGDVHGLEKKFAVTNDPKDLNRLTKARQRLAKVETGIAKEMRNGSKIQAAANKQQENLPKATDNLQDHTESREEIQRIISELKRKQDAIR